MAGSAEDEADEDAMMKDLLEDDAGDSTAHAIADEVGQIFGCSGRTIRDWATEFPKEETFALDLRGKTSPMHLLDDEDIKRRVTSFLTEKASAIGKDALTIDKFHQFVNDTLLKDLAEDPKYQDILSRTITKNAEATTPSPPRRPDCGCIAWGLRASGFGRARTRTCTRSPR